MKEFTFQVPFEGRLKKLETPLSSFSYLVRLPKDSLFEIFTYLHPNDIEACRKASTFFHPVANNQLLWRILFSQVTGKIQDDAVHRAYYRKVGDSINWQNLTLDAWKLCRSTQENECKQVEKFINSELIPYLNTEKIQQQYNLYPKKFCPSDTYLGYKYCFPVWRLVFHSWMFLDMWIAFIFHANSATQTILPITERKKTRVTQDQFLMLYEFAECCKKDPEFIYNYDPNDCWPVVIDEFMEFLQPSLNKLDKN